jgi:hypothetical protein
VNNDVRLFLAEQTADISAIAQIEIATARNGNAMGQMRCQLAAHLAAQKAGSAGDHDSLSLQVHLQLPCIAIALRAFRWLSEIGGGCSHNGLFGSSAVNVNASIACTFVAMAAVGSFRTRDINGQEIVLLFGNMSTDRYVARVSSRNCPKRGTGPLGKVVAVN